MEDFQELARKKFSAITLLPGDTLNLVYTPPGGGEQVLVTTILAERDSMVVTEGVIFKALHEGRRALGGIVLEGQK